MQELVKERGQPHKPIKDARVLAGDSSGRIDLAMIGRWHKYKNALVAEHQKWKCIFSLSQKEYNYHHSKSLNLSLVKEHEGW